MTEELREVLKHQEECKSRMSNLSTALLQAQTQLSSTNQTQAMLAQQADASKNERIHMTTLLTQSIDEHKQMLETHKLGDSQRKQREEEHTRALLGMAEGERHATKKAQREAQKHKERAEAAEATLSQMTLALEKQTATHESRMNALLDAVAEKENTTVVLI